MALVGEAYGGKLVSALGALLRTPFRLLPGVAKKKRLTETYLLDPTLRARLASADTSDL